MPNSSDELPSIYSNYTIHLYCTIIDNFGDIGVCWRLARQLADEYGQTVNLWVDDWQATRRMIPDLPETPTEWMVEGVCVRAWAQAQVETDCTGDVLIEGFGCTLPDAVLAQLAQRKVKPAWINLEYFSAELWVEGFHRQSGYDATVGTRRWFFFPGVHTHSGGMLRERDLLARRAVWQADDHAQEFLIGLGIQIPATSPTLKVVCFAYAHAPYEEWLTALCQHSTQPVSLWLCGGYSQAAVLTLAPSLCAQVSVYSIPFVAQPEFDRLLWSADILFVRGEDSLVRALWSGKPFVWQIYPQSEQAHYVKLQAWLDFYTQGFPVALREAYQVLHAIWNGISQQPMQSAWDQIMTEWVSWQHFSQLRCEQCARASDLAARLIGFVRAL